MAISNILKLFGGSSRSDNSASSGNCAKNVSGSQTKKISDDQEASGVVINGGAVGCSCRCVADL